MPDEPASSVRDLSVLRLTSIILRYRVVIAAVGLGIGFVAGLSALLSKPHYTAVASFTPQPRAAASAISGLVSQFGLAVPGIAANNSPPFYADLLASRLLLEGVIDSRFHATGDGDTMLVSLVDVLKANGATPALRRDAAIGMLRNAVSATASARTGVVTLSVTMPSPELARDVAQRFLDLLSAFNVQTRQSQASQERRFAENRVTELRAELKSAEDREQAFLQRNREFRSSPQLSFEYDRLARDVAMRQQVYTTLMQLYEQAKIEEVRDTPVITLIQSPEIPARRDARGTIRRTILGCLLGGALGVVLALWKDFVRNPVEANRPEVREFLQLRAELFADVRHPVRAAKRMLDRATSAGRKV